MEFFLLEYDTRAKHTTNPDLTQAEESIKRHIASA
jgi:hypothetical protein